MLTLAMVVSMAPATVFAEEIPGATGCTHVHDGSCGYVEAVAEVPCDRGCTDMDGDGVTDHADDCAYTPAVEGQPCMHVHDESCGGLTAEAEVQEPSGEEVGGEQPGEAEPGTTESGETDPEEGDPEQTELPEELRALQERIDALPTGDEYRAMSEDEQEAVYMLAAEIAEEYAELSEEDQAKLDITRMEELFAVMNEDVERYENSTVTFLNSGYPYGKNMNSNSITLVIDVEGDVSSYQWQVADSKDGTYSDISGAAASTYAFTPTSGSWYRCVVDGNVSEAVMAVKPGEDGRKWTRPYDSWYIGNGTMAYMANGTQFDVTGLYTKKGKNYMLQTSSGIPWDLYSSGSATPKATSIYSATSASLDALRVSFDARDDYAVIFEADLADGQRAFSFGCDTMLGNYSTSGFYSDTAALNAMVKNGVLQQIAMIGAATVEKATDEDPAFVIAPIGPVSRFWIGYFNDRKAYAYNTSGGTSTEMIDGQSVVTLLEGKDSGMTMSWMNIPSGGSVKFQFSVGNVAHTGAVGGKVDCKVDCKVDYEKEMLTGLDAGTTYIITYGESTYTITANVSGEIPLAGMDNDGNAYDFAGKSLNITKQGSEDTPAEVEVAGRPDTPNANIKIVEFKTTSVTITPVEGQEYAYSTDGTNWTTITGIDAGSNYVIEGFSEGDTVQIRTRVPATSTSPASPWSEATVVELMRTIAAAVTSWSGTYDGNAHGITVNVTSPETGANITYSSTEDGVYSSDMPTYTAAGNYTVYYRISAGGYKTTSGSTTVTIDPKEVALEWGNTDFTYNGNVQAPVATVKAESLCGEDTCTVTVTGGNKNAGDSYTATATGVNNSNYKLPETGTTTSFSIAKKEIGVNWGNAQLTYNGTEQKPTAALDGVIAGDTCNLNVTGAQTNVGDSYTATASVTNPNYTIRETDVSKEFRIAPKSLEAETVTVTIDETSYGYDGNDKTPVITVKDAERNVTLTKDTDYVLSGDLTKSELSSQDGYVITVTGKGNYTGSVNKTWKIVKSASVITTDPVAAPITYGQLLGDSVLTPGVAKTDTGVTIPGTFRWSNTENKPTVADGGVTRYDVTFTPDDTTKFEPVTCQVKLTVNPKIVTLSWGESTFTYNGKEQKPAAVVSNLEEKDQAAESKEAKVTVIVSGGQIDANTKTELDAVNGGYTATAVSLTGEAAANYKLSDTASDNQKKFKIYPKKLTVAMVTAVTAYPYTENAITPTISVKDQVADAGGTVETTLVKDRDYTLSGDVSGIEVRDGYKLTVTGTGNYTDSVDVAWKITDAKAPTGTIKVAQNEWKELINELSFGIFFKTRQTVTIKAADEGSGVAAVSYFLTSNDTLMDQEALAKLPDTKWTKFANANGGSFVINPDKKYVIYAKITDQSGNVTFISSNGIVLDQTAPEIKGIANGKTYCSDVTFTVSDSIGLASVKIDGVDHGTGGSYSIASGSEKETHTIEAADTAGNKTKYTVTINASGTHSFDSKWTEEKPATCTEKGIRSHKCSSCGFVEMQEIAELGHSYEMKAENVHFVWEGKKDDGSITEDHVKAYFICQNDSDHIKLADSCSVTSKTTTPATVSSAGKIIYTAKAAFGKNEYTATKTVILEKLQKLDVDAATDANSNIYTSTSVADEAPATTIDEGLDLELAKKLMTAAEEANYNDANVATDVTVYLEVQNITGAVPAADTQKVQSEITDLITRKVNADANVEVEAKAGDTTYLDLSMYKNVTTKEDDVVTSDTTTQITDTEKNIKITVTIPAGLPDVAAGFNRVFHIIRVHDGIAEILPTDRNGNSLTFQTSKFSTYAISYVDVKETPVPSSSGGGSVAVPVTKITVSSDSEKTTLTKAGETLQLTVQITPANATNKKVTWSSSDPKVATVDENGKVTAVGDGTVTITAKTGNGRTATFTITVKIKPEKEDGKDDDAGNTGGSSGKITLDTTYRKLALRASASTKTTNVLKWNKVADADGYVIYGNRCNSKGKTYQMVKQAVIKDNATTTWTDKALTSGTYYKYYIKAYKLVNGKKVWLSKSKVVHTTTAGGKFGNAKSLKVNKTTVSLAKGKTFAIKAEQILKKLPIQKHASIKYESSNSKIASVTRKGVIKAKKKGICYIYVYAQNGKYRRIKVTVK